MKSALLAVAAAAALAPAAQAATTIYSTDFASGTGGFTGSGVAAVTPSGEHYLELYNGNAATITLNTAGYTGLSVSLNLYGIQSVDGNGPDGGGADPFLVYINGAATPAYDINIANYNSGSNSQSFNGNLAESGPGHTYTPRTGEIAEGTLGYGTGPFGDSTYLLTFALPDSALTTLTFVGQTNEASTSSTGGFDGNEAYGIDNVALTGTATVAAVPEPASWAMFIGGFGVIGTAARRRRVTLRFA